MRRTIDRSNLPPSNPLECRDTLPKFRRSWERLGLNFNRGGAFKARLKEVAEQDAKTQRRGKSWKPLTPGGRSTISVFHGTQCVNLANHRRGTCNLDYRWQAGCRLLAYVCHALQGPVVV
jgi:hypothetical protein